MVSSKKKIKALDRKNLDDLIIIGKTGKRAKRHWKKVQELNELLEMRMERKKRIKELIAKRTGTFKIKL